MMFKKLIPFLLMVAMLFVVSCDNPTNDGGGGGGSADNYSSSDFVGTWSWDVAGVDVEFTSDGDITLGGEEIGAWSVDESNATITMEFEDPDDGSTETFVYTLDEPGGDGTSNIPVWTDEDGEELSTIDAPVLEQIVEDEESSDEESSDDGSGDTGELEEITGIAVSESRSGMNISWTPVDGSRSYMVSINGEADSDLPITGIPYRPADDVVEGDVIKVEAFSDPNTEDLIAVGTITYGESADEGETSDDTTSDDTTSDDTTSDDTTSDDSGDTSAATLENFAGTWVDSSSDVQFDLQSSGSGSVTFDGVTDSLEWSIDTLEVTITIEGDEFTLDVEAQDNAFVLVDYSGTFGETFESTDAVINS